MYFVLDYSRFDLDCAQSFICLRLTCMWRWEMVWNVQNVDTCYKYLTHFETYHKTQNSHNNLLLCELDTKYSEADKSSSDSDTHGDAKCRMMAYFVDIYCTAVFPFHELSLMSTTWWKETYENVYVLPWTHVGF